MKILAKAAMAGLALIVTTAIFLVIALMIPGLGFRDRVLVGAANSGYLTAVTALLSLGADPNSKDRRGRPVIVVAAARGHSQILRTLLDAGASRDAADSSGFGPILMAAREGHANALTVLLQAGANPNQKLLAGNLGLDSSYATVGATVLLWDAVHLRYGVFVYGPRRSADAGDFTPLLLAACNGHSEAADVLASNGADVNGPNSAGLTPLMVASICARPATITVLITRGADVNAEYGVRRFTPIALAATVGCVDCLRILISRGAAVNVRDAVGATPLMWATARGNIDAVRAVVQGGADVYALDKAGRTALQWAQEDRRTAIAQFLIETGSSGRR